MKKQKIVLIFIAIILVALLAGKLIQHEPVIDSNAYSIAPAVAITYQNLASALSQSTMIQDIPKNGDILLKFYNFNSGQRAWEKSFLISKGIVTETNNQNENADIILSLDSRYLNGLTNQNFCSMIQQANKNGDLGFESELSEVSLAWKFKSMYKYRDCFGF